MKRSLVLVTILLVLLATMALPAMAITWGEEDGNKHPNVALISRPDPGNEDHQRPFCSGTLIDEKVLLTAGHCTRFLEELIEVGELTERQVMVSFDTENALEEGLLPVAEIRTHPDYGDSSANPYDVGALVLAEPVTDIELAELPDEGYLDDLKAQGVLGQGRDGVEFIVVGYGSTLEWPPPDIIFPDGVRRVAVSHYRALTKVWLHLSQIENQDDGGTCYGDSGGPVFWEQKKKSQVLVGITSWGDAQCVASGFYYRTDIPDTMNFIQGVLDSLD